MSKRRAIKGYRLTHLVITHSNDDHAPFNGKRHSVVGDPGTGRRPAFTMIQFEGNSDRILFKTLLAIPHHGSTALDISSEPPKLAEFLMLLLPMKYRKELVGCAEEEYWTRSLPRLGPRRARVIFWTQMIHAWLIFLARPFAGIAGLAWVGKIVEAVLSKMLR